MGRSLIDLLRTDFKQLLLVAIQDMEGTDEPVPAITMARVRI